MTKSKGQIQREFLEKVLDSGGSIEKVNFSVARHFVATHPTYYVTLRQNGTLTLQQLPWTPDLEEYLLLTREIRTETEDEEIERFATILSNNLATIERQVGKEFARAVLVEVLAQRTEYALDDLLERVAAAAPSHESVEYANCHEFLSHAIDGLQNTAVRSLKYSGEEARRLMAKALRIMLDDRFQVSLRDPMAPRQ